MNNDPESNELLDDVLAEGVRWDAGSAMLEQMLARVRRRRAVRRTLASSGALVLAGLLSLLFLKTFKAWRVVTLPLAPSYVLVHSAPLSKDRVVETRRLASDALVFTTANCTAVVGTHDGVHAMGDSELLELISPRPAILIKGQSNSEELVFLNPADRNGFGTN
jgi:hypothetical protein